MKTQLFICLSLLLGLVPGSTLAGVPSSVEETLYYDETPSAFQDSVCQESSLASDIYDYFVDVLMGGENGAEPEKKCPAGWTYAGGDKTKTTSECCQWKVEADVGPTTEESGLAGDGQEGQKVCVKCRECKIITFDCTNDTTNEKDTFGTERFDCDTECNRQCN